MPRLFVAIDLDPETRAAMAGLQKRLQADGRASSGLRWLRPEQLHLTLVFLGEVEESRAGVVAGAIGAPVDRDAFEVEFGGVGAFPPRGAPRALWVGAQRGGEELRALQRVLVDRLVQLGVPLESRPFSPHLTLGRWKASRPSDRRRVLDVAPQGRVARSWIDHATLYRSQLSSTGSTYTPLARATLKSRP